MERIMSGTWKCRVLYVDGCVRDVEVSIFYVEVSVWDVKYAFPDVGGW